MNECFKCGVSGDKRRLSDAISEKGIVSICDNCSSEEDIPIIKKPTTFQLKKSEAQLREGQTVYERLSHMSGYDLSNKKSEKEKELLKKQETTLKDIVDRNFEMRFKEESKPRPDLIHNFHWVIMRARRSKKLTQRKLAEAIAESEAAIKMAEEGVLPEDDYRLINKLEGYLGIKLIKKKPTQDISRSIQGEALYEDEKEIPKKIGFDPITAKTLTISDLQEMKKQKEDEILEKENYIFNENIDLNPEIAEEQPEFIIKENKDKDKEDLSEEDIRDLVFRK